MLLNCGVETAPDADKPRFVLPSQPVKCYQSGWGRLEIQVHPGNLLRLMAGFSAPTHSLISMHWRTILTIRGAAICIINISDTPPPLRSSFTCFPGFPVATSFWISIVLSHSSCNIQFLNIYAGCLRWGWVGAQWVWMIFWSILKQFW